MNISNKKTLIKNKHCFQKNKSIRRILRIPLNLTILSNKINKLKHIAKQNNLSVFALLVQIIDQL